MPGKGIKAWRKGQRGEGIEQRAREKRKGIQRRLKKQSSNEGENSGGTDGKARLLTVVRFSRNPSHSLINRAAITITPPIRARSVGRSPMPSQTQMGPRVVSNKVRRPTSPAARY